MNSRHHNKIDITELQRLCNKTYGFIKVNERSEFENEVSKRVDKIFSIYSLVKEIQSHSKHVDEYDSAFLERFSEQQHAIAKHLVLISNMLYKKYKKSLAALAEKIAANGERGSIIEMLKMKENNLACIFKNIIKSDFCEKTAPATVTMELTSECNFRCAMCHQSNDSFYPFDSIDFECLQKMLHLFKWARVVALQLSGEPTLSPYFDAVCKAGHASAVELSLITNGSLLHTKLPALGALSSITVSFDGARSETFERQRRGANFQHIMKNIRELKATHPTIPVRFNCCVSRLNMEDLPEIIRIAHELKIQSVTFNLITTIGATKQKRSHLSNQLAFSENDFEELTGWLQKAKDVAQELKVSLFAPTLDRSNMPSYLASGTFLSAEETEMQIPIAQLMTFLDDCDSRSHKVQTGSQLLEKLDGILQHFDNIQIECHGSTNVPVQNLQSLEFAFIDQEAISSREEQKIIDYDHAVEGHVNIPFCMAVYTSLLVMANGGISLCCRSIGKELLSTERVMTIRKLFIESAPSGAPLDYCQGCNIPQRYMLLSDYLRHCRRQGATWEQFVFPAAFRPQPGVQAQLNRLQMTIFGTGQAPLQLNSSFTFGQNGSAEAYCVAGFDEAASPNARWSNATESIFGFQLQRPRRDVTLALTIAPFISPQHCPIQEFDLFLNTTKITTLRLNSPAKTTLKVKLPVQVFTSRRSYYELRLQYKNATQPGRIGLSPCFLPRALLFHNLALS